MLRVKLIGREIEKKELSNAIGSQRSELVVVTGLPGVGKSILVDQIFCHDIVWKVSAMVSASLPEQINHFVFNLGRSFPDLLVEKYPKTWSEAFDLLSKALSSTKFRSKKVVLIEDVPLFASRKSGFDQALLNFWDEHQKSKDLVLVLMGSRVAWMIKKFTTGDFASKTTQFIFLKPLSLAEVYLYFQNRNSSLTKNQILFIYMTLGGFPALLEKYNPVLSIDKNIENIYFEGTAKNTSLLNEYFARIFENPVPYLTIIKAFGSKAQSLTRKEIVDNTSLKNGGMLTEKINDLIQAGIIVQHSIVRKKSKGQKYRIIDFFTFFFLTFSGSETGAKSPMYKDISINKYYNIWCNYALKNIVHLHLNELKWAMGIAGISTRLLYFEDLQNRRVNVSRTDLVLERDDGCLQVLDVKYISDRMATYLIEGNAIDTSLESLEPLLNRKSSVEYIVVSNAEVRLAESLDIPVRIIPIEALFEKPKLFAHFLQ